MAIARFIDIPLYKDERGALNVIEGVALPFVVRRIYNIFEVGVDEIRGLHAHKTLEQLFVCLAGSVEVILSNGEKKETVLLNNRSKVLHIMPGTWRELHFLEANTVLSVLASQQYDADDYIWSYNEFVNWAKDYR